MIPPVASAGSVVHRVKVALVRSPIAGETVKNERRVLGLIEKVRDPQRAALLEIFPLVSTAITV